MNILRYIKVLCLVMFFIPSISQSYFMDLSEELTFSKDIYENAYMLGGIANVSGDIAGDLMLMGGDIYVNNSVNNDITAIGGNIDIESLIGDDARIIGGNIKLASTISGEVIIIGGQIDIKPDTHIYGDTFIAGGNVVLSGIILGDVKIYADNITILDDNFRIIGDLTYFSQSELKNISDYVSGETIFTQGIQDIDNFSKDIENKINQAYDDTYNLRLIWTILGVSVISIILVLLFPPFFNRAVELIQNYTAYTYLTGFLFILFGGVLGGVLMLLSVSFGLLVIHSWITFSFTLYDIIITTIFSIWVFNCFKIQSKLVIVLLIILITILLEIIVIGIGYLPLATLIKGCLYFIVFAPILGGVLLSKLNIIKD